MSQFITPTQVQQPSAPPVPSKARKRRPKKTAANRSRKVKPKIEGLANGPNDSNSVNGRHELRVSVCEHRRSNFWTLNCTWGRLVGLASTHDAREKKDGLALIFAELSEYRTGADVLSIFALAYEVDGKLSLDEVRHRVQESGFEAAVWTTHNHLRTQQSLGLASYKKWHQKTFGIDGQPTNEGVKLYCSAHKSYKHLENVRLADGGKTRKVKKFGTRVVVFDIAHEPEHKTRIVFPLTKPISLQPESLSIADFKAIYHAHGEQIFGEAYSTESQNPARLHYLPSHPPGGSGETHVFNGELLDPEPIRNGIKESASFNKEERVSSRRSPAPSAGLDELEYVLRQIPSDLEYPDWFKCIAVIFHETGGSNAGAELAHSWSSDDARYNFNEVELIWDSLDPHHAKPAKLGTLVRLARQHNDAFRPLKPMLNKLQLILSTKGISS